MTTRPTSEYRGDDRLLFGIILGVLVIPLMALVAATIFFRTRFGWRGFLPGILIAFGLVALLVGACFAIIMVSMSGSSMH